MISGLSILALAILLNCTVKSSGGTRHSISRLVAAARMDTYGDDQAEELSLLMDQLVVVYTPRCLRVVIAVPESYNVYNSTTEMGSTSTTTSDSSYFTYTTLKENGNANVEEPKTLLYFSISAKTLSQFKNALDYIITNIEKVNPFNCVTYLLPELPDFSVLALLTDQSSSKRLTRHFLIYFQNSTKAEQFLLDQRLGEEENVAAVVKDKSPNKTYWRVLIRQLLHPSGSPQVLTVNRWSRDTGLTSTENIFPEQMANFYGQRLTGVVLSFLPFISYRKTEGSLNVELKSCIDKFLLDTISEKLNFTYGIIVPADGQWGYPDKNGQWVGKVRELETRRANFSLNLSMTKERRQVIDYTRSYFMDALTFVTAKRPPSPPWRKVFTPFRTDVWLCVLISVGGGALLYHIIYHVQATLTSSRLLSSHAFMHVLASFLSQSLHSYLSLQAGKIFLGFWFLYAFLITTYYKTSLTSTLAVPYEPINIDTLADLLQSGLSYGMKPSKGAVYTLFARADSGLYLRMFTDMQYHGTTDSMSLVAEGEYAFIYWKSNLDPLVARHNNDPRRTNDIHMAKDKFFPGRKAWGVPKGAPYERTFGEVMKRCGHAGLIDKWTRDSIDIFLKEWQKERETEGITQTTMVTKKETLEVVFSLNHLQGPFLMLVFGYGGGALLLLMELLTTKFLVNSL